MGDYINYQRNRDANHCFFPLVLPHVNFAVFNKAQFNSRQQVYWIFPYLNIHKHDVCNHCVQQWVGKSVHMQNWSDVLWNWKKHTPDFKPLLKVIVNRPTLQCPDSVNCVLSFRNWLRVWTSLPTLAFRIIPSGPTSSSGKPLSTVKSRARSEPFIWTPQGRRLVSLPG